MTSSYEARADNKPPVTLASLESALVKQRERAEADPFSNPIVSFAIDLTRRIDRGEIGLSDLDHIVQDATVEAFRNRAERLNAYLGDTDPDTNLAALTAQLQSRAKDDDFAHFRDVVERPLAGIVLTAHPTFAMPLTLARALTELACGRTREGAAIDEAACEYRLALARKEPHRPPEGLTLEVEHAWSLEALANTHQAIDALHRVIFAPFQPGS